MGIIILWLEVTKTTEEFETDRRSGVEVQGIGLCVKIWFSKNHILKIYSGFLREAALQYLWGEVFSGSCNAREILSHEQELQDVYFHRLWQALPVTFSLNVLFGFWVVSPQNVPAMLIGA